MKAVNLLPGDTRGAAKAPTPAAKQAKPEGDAFGAYAVLGLLAVAVLAAAAVVLTQNSIADRTAEHAKVKAQTASVAAQAAALKPYADFKALADARVQTVQSLANSRFDWEQTLRDMSRALPREVRLTSLKGTAVGGGASGATSPTVELSGCTTDHTAVARLMGRLRAVRGVTRVALASSTKGGSGSSICGAVNPPTFSLSIKFERFGVPAVSAPVGAAGAGVTGATGATGPAAATPTTPPATGSSGVAAP